MSKNISLYFVENYSEGDTDQQLIAMKKCFHLTRLPENADVIFCASIVKMNEALAVKSHTQKPLVVYCWDYYLWAHEGKHHDGSNWKAYATFLQNADLVIVPSSSQQLRLKELLGIDSVVVRTGIKTYEEPVEDGGYILDPVRYYPEENRDWAERAAKELGIPIVHSEHQFTEENFRKLVACCTFMTCAYREASTGGLTLMEGLALGKPSLVSNSPYMGAKDYLGNLGEYFQYDDFKDLKKKMLKMWKQRRVIDKKVAQKHLRDFTFDKMAEGLHKAICEILKK